MENNNVSTGKWFLYIILANLPFLGVICTLFWCFAPASNPNIKSWARAQLIIALIQAVICIFIAYQGQALLGFSFT